MSITRTPEDSWTKEMQKWETRPVLLGGTYIQPLPREQGGRLNHPYEEYPKMLYRAESANGGPRICDSLIVKDESEERRELARGWAPTQELALEGVHAQQQEFARLAANRAYNDRWMSGKAKAEAAAVDETTANHLPAIPVKPIKRRGRQPGYKVKPKAAAPAAEG